MVVVIVVLGAAGSGKSSLIRAFLQQQERQQQQQQENKGAVPEVLPAVSIGNSIIVDSRSTQTDDDGDTAALVAAADVVIWCIDGSAQQEQAEHKPPVFPLLDNSNRNTAPVIVAVTKMDDLKADVLDATGSSFQSDLFQQSPTRQIAQEWRTACLVDAVLPTSTCALSSLRRLFQLAERAAGVASVRCLSTQEGIQKCRTALTRVYHNIVSSSASSQQQQHVSCQEFVDHYISLGMGDSSSSSENRDNDENANGAQDLWRLLQSAGYEVPSFELRAPLQQQEQMGTQGMMMLSATGCVFLHSIGQDLAEWTLALHREPLQTVLTRWLEQGYFVLDPLSGNIDARRVLQAVTPRHPEAVKLVCIVGSKATTSATGVQLAKRDSTTTLFSNPRFLLVQPIEPQAFRKSRKQWQAADLLVVLPCDAQEDIESEALSKRVPVLCWEDDKKDEKELLHLLEDQFDEFAQWAPPAIRTRFWFLPSPRKVFALVVFAAAAAVGKRIWQASSTMTTTTAASTAPVRRVPVQPFGFKR